MASIGIPIRVSADTTSSQLAALEILLQNFLNCHSAVWHVDSLFTLITDFKIKQYIEVRQRECCDVLVNIVCQVTIWATLGSSWSSWRLVHDHKTEWYLYLARCAELLELEYQLPKQPVAVSGGLETDQKIEPGFMLRQALQRHVEPSPSQDNF